VINAFGFAFKTGCDKKVLENLYGKVTEVESSIREVFIMMKMLET
jgi:hypothetical protein